MVLFLCEEDYSNLSYTLAQSLKSVGINAMAIATKPHKFYKVNCAKVCDISHALQLANNANVIIWMHSQQVLISHLKNLRKVTKIVFHGGTKYRKDPKKINNIFNFVDRSIIQTGELLGLGAINEHWLLPPVDTELIKPIYNTIGDKKIIAHFPSKTITKGSNVINSIMNELSDNDSFTNKFDYRYSTTNIAWNKNIKRMSNCDIYIDAFCPRLGKKQYGEWGIQALEAAALGKIIITHFGMWRQYKKEYGDCALQYINTQKELKQKLQNLIEMNNDEIQNLKIRTRKWVETHHSLKAVGMKLRKIIQKPILRSQAKVIIPHRKRLHSSATPIIRPPKKRRHKLNRQKRAH